ncbi:expressed unknown protein [Ectocarpus siliculosus]|uniref:Uncharacterized protein n=1 Tax=Ectocarpus siliculosus TaxID=2880 RepID=D8LFL4_ECTSI|nr:expressed unknown protein [Ectocarpus siliculosus]|eukprot:CBN79934.1 expressed unknown protein [Ectocarpus siliculosus]
MFDTHDNAHAYQVRCKKVGTFSLPILVEEDGASLERNGYMPPAKDPDSLNRLKIVYGAMPPHLTPEYVKTERFVKQLKNLIPALEQVLEATAEVSEVESGNDADRWRQEINSLTKELDDLMSRGTPSKRGGGAGGRSAGKVARIHGRRYVAFVAGVETSGRLPAVVLRRHCRFGSALIQRSDWPKIFGDGGP